MPSTNLQRDPERSPAAACKTMSINCASGACAIVLPLYCILCVYCCAWLLHFQKYLFRVRKCQSKSSTKHTATTRPHKEGWDKSRRSDAVTSERP